MSFAEKVQNKRGRVDPKELKKLLKLAYELQVALETGDMDKLKVLEQSKALLAMLLEYLILNLSSQNVDVELINLIARFLGRDLRKEKDSELEEEREEELSKEEKERRHRLMVYEIYKMLNPRRLAGETEIENFIKNVLLRGIDVAVKYEGAEFAKCFDIKELQNLESLGHGFKVILKGAGFKGAGLGM